MTSLLTAIAGTPRGKHAERALQEGTNGEEETTMCCTPTDADGRVEAAAASPTNFDADVAELPPLPVSMSWGAIGSSVWERSL